MNNNRALFVLVVVILFYLTIIIKLFDIQILKSDELKYYAERQQNLVEVVKAKRGLIYDRGNTLLAYNEDDVSYFLDLRMFPRKQKQSLAEKFSKTFGKPVQHYLSIIERKKAKMVCLEKKVSSKQLEELKDYKVLGLKIEKDPTRTYTYGNIASHVLGYLDRDFNAKYGIEKYCDDILKGVDGQKLVERDAIGDIITVSENNSVAPINGTNIHLTIDKEIQRALEEELENGMKQFGGESAIGIIMDPNTGEIIALANKKDFNPNEFWKFTDRERRNRAISDVYDPGSTFKSITLAALLEEKKCTLSERINTENGRYVYKNATISDVHGKDVMSVQSIMEQSSNIGFSKLVQRLDDNTFFEYVRSFGMGNYTNIDIPGEVKGTLKNPNEWSGITKAFMSFGYGLNVTPIQMITAYCAIINGGILYQPHIIKKEISSNGNVVEYSPKEVRKVISKSTSDKMKNLMVGVVENGSGKNAILTFTKAGGKTGTSRKYVNGVYSTKEYNSSFIGFFPADNPKYVCFILFISPSNGSFGGAVAAPVFKATAERINKLYPDQFRQKSEKQDSKEIKVMYANESGTDKVKFSNQNSGSNEAEEYIENRIMPDLTKLSLREATNILMKSGVKYKIKGTGKIVSQSIPSGSKIKKNNVCVITCSNG